MALKLPASKRYRFSIIIIVINLIIGVTTLLIAPSVLVAMGTFLLMANSPLYAYLLGDSYRPSGYVPATQRPKYETSKQQTEQD